MLNLRKEAEKPKAYIVECEHHSLVVLYSYIEIKVNC